MPRPWPNSEERARREALSRAAEEAKEPRVIRLRVSTRPEQPLEWKLGPGPCGRTVESLDFAVTAMGVAVYQKCTDHTEPDKFFYPTAVVQELRVYRVDNPEPACHLPL